MKINRYIKQCVPLLLSLLLVGCHHPNQQHSTIVIGTMSGPETELVKVASKVALKKHKLVVKDVIFSDYSLPNRALAAKNIDANMFQHRPFLEADMKAHGYHLAIVGKTFIYPMGVYSHKITKLNQLPNGAKVAIPDDISNEARALLMLEKAGLIRLAKGVTVTATPKDIIFNPKKLKFVELDGASLPRTLNTVAIAVINNNYAAAAGLKLDHALYAEGANSLYANLLVVRKGDENKAKVKQLLAALHSKEVVAKAGELFGKGGAIPAWKENVNQKKDSQSFY